MNYLGLTVFAGNTPGLILDFDPVTKEYTVEFTDGRVVKTAKVFWDKTIPSEPDIAFYRQSSLGNGERLWYDPEIGWDVISAAEEGIDIVNEPSDLDEWVDDYTSEEETDHQTIEEKLDEVLDTLNELKDRGEIDPKDKSEELSAVQDMDHDATEDSYWDRSTKPNPMAYDEEFPSGNYNERNPGTLNPTAKTAKDCGCWDGYKRVPGTKPCAPGSCEKCDAARKESAAKKHNPEEAVKKVNTKPPAGVRAAAKRGLKYYEEGKAGDGFEAATADRARKIAAGEELTEEHINRMHSFFERHAGGRSQKAKPGEVTAWDVAWLCWGGDAGRSWAAKVDAQLHKARHPNSKGKHSADAGAGVFDFVNNEDDTDHMRSDIGGNSNVRHAEGEAQKNQHGDQEGNPEVRGLGDSDVFFPEPPLDVLKVINEQTKDKLNPNEEVWEKVHAHVRDQSDWMDEHYANKMVCPTCSDPLVDGNCYVCGENKKKQAKAIAKRQKRINKITKSLAPRAAELGVLFGEALAGTRQSVTEPSEDVFAIHIDGQDSDPSIGGTGGYNAQHGDSPEYLKDVDGYAGFIDATPELVVEGMPHVIEMSESDESGEDNKFVKALEKFFDEILGDDFTKNKEEAKEKKESSIKEAMGGIPGAFGYGESYVNEGGNSVQNMPTTPVGVSQSFPAERPRQEKNPNDNYCNWCKRDFIDGKCTSGATRKDLAPPQCEAFTQPIAGQRQYSAGFEGDSDNALADIDGNPLEVGQTYRVYAGSDAEPDVVKVVESDPNAASVVRVDSAFPDNEGEPYKISAEQFEVENIRFDKADQLNPNEIGMDSPPPTDGTPETNNDAGPGHEDMVGETDLSTGRKANVEHTAGRHYYPNQQKEFINESGKARNLDKLVLEGTHYVDDDSLTASSDFDDDFLFGV